LKSFLIETNRLMICEFAADLAEAVHLNSLDENNRRFVPDEVFETIEDAKETVEYLIGRYGSDEGPFVYPVLLRTGTCIGHVQIAQIEDGWEIGYHIAKDHTGRGYATEAVRAFLPVIAEQHHIREIYGICLAENKSSVRVMEKCGFTPLYRGPGTYQGEEREIVRCIWHAQEPVRIAYRKLTEKDLDAFISLRIAQLREEGAKEGLDLTSALMDYYLRHLADGTFVSWLAMDEGRIIGTSGMSFVEKPPYFGCPTGKIGLLSSMYTDPDYRRKGIAKELLSRVVEEARLYGCGAVQITASDMGVLLYTDFGFVKNGNFMQYKL